MVSGKLVMITAAVFAWTGLCTQRYIESSSSTGCDAAAIERRVETRYGPSLLPLVEAPVPRCAERVSKTRVVRETPKLAKSNRKAPVVKSCSESATKSATKMAPLKPANPVGATIQMFESYR